MTTNITAIVERLAAKKVSHINISNNSAPRIEAYIQTLLCRSLDLASGAILSFNNNCLISGVSAAKSLCETVAITIWFEKELSDAVKLADKKAINQLLIKYLHAHGSRNEELRQIAIAHMHPFNEDGKAAQATNAVTIIEKCAKAGYEEIQKIYDGLCEHDHPNALGTYLFFTHVDPNQKDIIFINPSEATMNEARGWIKNSLKLLLTFEKTFESLETKVLLKLRELLSKETI